MGHPDLPPPFVVEVAHVEGHSSGTLQPQWQRDASLAVWKDLPVFFSMASMAPWPTGSRSEVDVALRSWSSPSCSGWRSERGPDSTTVTTLARDGANTIAYVTDASFPFGSEAVGRTVLYVDNGEIVEADIFLNGAFYIFSTDGTPGTVDLRSILLHEIGHALGLAHSTDAQATMFPSIPFDLSRRSMEDDDRAGACALYPGQGVAECGSARACPEGFSCLAARCEREGVPGAVCSPCDPTQASCRVAGESARCVSSSTADAGNPTTEAPTRYVCGRSCVAGENCGPGFTCAPTSEAGDLQCVPTDGCGVPLAQPPVAATGDGGASEDAELRGGGCAMGRPRQGPARFLLAFAPALVVGLRPRKRGRKLMGRCRQ